MDGLGSATAGNIKNLVDVEVRLARCSRADVIGVVSLAHMQCFAVDIRENGDGLDAHLAAGTNDAYGNLAAIGDQDSLEHAETWILLHPSPPTSAKVTEACDHVRRVVPHGVLPVERKIIIRWEHEHSGDFAAEVGSEMPLVASQEVGRSRIDCR